MSSNNTNSTPNKPRFQSPFSNRKRTWDLSGNHLKRPSTSSSSPFSRLKKELHQPLSLHNSPVKDQNKENDGPLRILSSSTDTASYYKKREQNVEHLVQWLDGMKHKAIDVLKEEQAQEKLEYEQLELERLRLESKVTVRTDSFDKLKRYLDDQIKINESRNLHNQEQDQDVDVVSESYEEELEEQYVSNDGEGSVIEISDEEEEEAEDKLNPYDVIHGDSAEEGEYSEEQQYSQGEYLSEEASDYGGENVQPYAVENVVRMPQLLNHQADYDGGKINYNSDEDSAAGSLSDQHSDGASQNPEEEEDEEEEEEVEARTLASDEEEQEQDQEEHEQLHVDQEPLEHIEHAEGVEDIEALIEQDTMQVGDVAGEESEAGLDEVDKLDVVSMVDTAFSEAEQAVLDDVGADIEEEVADVKTPEYVEETFYDSDNEPFRSPSRSLFGGLQFDDLNFEEMEGRVADEAHLSSAFLNGFQEHTADELALGRTVSAPTSSAVNADDEADVQEEQNDDKEVQQTFVSFSNQGSFREKPKTAASLNEEFDRSVHELSQSKPVYEPSDLVKLYGTAIKHRPRQDQPSNAPKLHNSFIAPPQSAAPHLQHQFLPHRSFPHNGPPVPQPFFFDNAPPKTGGSPRPFFDNLPLPSFDPLSDMLFGSGTGTSSSSTVKNETGEQSNSMPFGNALSKVFGSVFEPAAQQEAQEEQEDQLAGSSHTQEEEEEEIEVDADVEEDKLNVIDSDGENGDDFGFPAPIEPVSVPEISLAEEEEEEEENQEGFVTALKSSSSLSDTQNLLPAIEETVVPEIEANETPSLNNLIIEQLEVTDYVNDDDYVDEVYEEEQENYEDGGYYQNEPAEDQDQDQEFSQGNYSQEPQYDGYEEENSLNETAPEGESRYSEEGSRRTEDPEKEQEQEQDEKEEEEEEEEEEEGEEEQEQEQEQEEEIPKPDSAESLNLETNAQSAETPKAAEDATYVSPVKRLWNYVFGRKGREAEIEIISSTQAEPAISEANNTDTSESFTELSASTVESLDRSSKRLKTETGYSVSHIVMKTRSGKIIGANTEEEISKAQELEKAQDQLIFNASQNTDTARDLKSLIDSEVLEDLKEVESHKYTAVVDHETGSIVGEVDSFIMNDMAEAEALRKKQADDFFAQVNETYVPSGESRFSPIGEASEANLDLDQEDRRFFSIGNDERQEEAEEAEPHDQTGDDVALSNGNEDQVPVLEQNGSVQELPALQTEQGQQAEEDEVKHNNGTEEIESDHELGPEEDENSENWTSTIDSSQAPSLREATSVRTNATTRNSSKDLEPELQPLVLRRSTRRAKARTQDDDIDVASQESEVPGTSESTSGRVSKQKKKRATTKKLATSASNKAKKSRRNLRSKTK